MTRKDFLATLGASAGALAAGGLRAAPALVGPASGGTTQDGTPTSTPANLANLITLEDFEAPARERMTPGAYAYVSSAAGDELTARWNREKFQELRLSPRTLVDVSRVDCSTTLFGQPMAMPILLAPVASQGMVHPEAEVATVRGANAAGASIVLSSGSNASIEEVVRAASRPVWFQLYVAKDRGLARDLIQRVQAAGAKALCVTVDAVVNGPRNRQDRTPMGLRPGMGYPHYVGVKEPPSLVTLDEVVPAKLDWRDIEWIRSLTRVPMLVKGLMNPLDAGLAIKAGADGIMVSNHGGRCLDTLPATIEVLPRIADTVNGRVPLILDGGIRRGTDVVKALALGASAVQIGRPYIYGLAVGGAGGVARVVKILRQELLMSMASLGRPNLASIDRSVIWR